MATKKQKRERMEKHYADRMEEHRQAGLIAQRRDHIRRERKKRADWQEQHDNEHSFKKLVDGCPHCEDRKKKASVTAGAKENK